MHRLKELLECLLVSAMDSQLAKENEPPNKRQWYQSLRKSLAKKICSKGKGLTCVPQTNVCRSPLQDANGARSNIKGVNPEELARVNIETIKIRVTQARFDEVELSARTTGYYMNQAGQLVPAVTIRNPQLADDVKTLQTSIYDEHLSIRRNCQCSGRSSACEVRRHRAANGRCGLVTSTISESEHRDNRSMHCRCCQHSAAATATTMTMTRSSTSCFVDQLTDDDPFAVSGSFERRHPPLSSKSVNDASCKCDSGYGSWSTQCESVAVDQQTADDVVTKKRQADCSGTEVDFLPVPRRRRSSPKNDDGGQTSKTATTTFHDRHLTAALLTQQQKLRRQRRFVGKSATGATPRRTTVEAQNDDSCSADDEQHPNRRRRVSKRSLQTSVDQSLSTTATSNAFDSCLNRGFLLVAEDGNMNAEDSVVRSTRHRRRQHSQPRCQWNPDMSPIGRPSSAAGDPPVGKLAFDAVSGSLLSPPVKLPAESRSMKPTHPSRLCRDVTRERDVAPDVRWQDDVYVPQSRQRCVSWSRDTADFLGRRLTNETTRTNGLDSSETPKSSDLRCELIRDLVDCEMSFVRQMSIGAERFSRPLRHCRELSFDSWLVLFQNIEKLSALSQYHLQLLTDRNSCLVDPAVSHRTNVAGHFPHRVGLVYRSTVRLLLEAYHQYKSGLATAMRLAQQIRTCTDDSSLRSAIADDEFGLEQFLKMPVDHLLALHLRMKLLLESPIGYDDRDNDDRIALQSVIRAMNEEIKSWH